MNTQTQYPSFSAAEFSRRFSSVRAAMRAANCETLIFYSTTGSYHEVLYLSNFITSREACLVFPAEGDPTLFVQMFNHVPNARQLATIDDVRWGGPDTMLAVAENVRERKLDRSRIGLVGSFSFKQYDLLKNMLPHADLADFTPKMSQLRLIKSEEEMAFLRQGAEFSDLAMEALEREARPGITEHELAAIVEASYLGLGGKNHIHYMGTTPMEHPSLCVPSQTQSNRVLQAGDVLITEISAHYNGYAGQILRPFAIATPPTLAYQKMYDVAVEAFNRIAAVIRPGTTTDEVLDVSEYIHEAGFTICDDLLHGFGGGYLKPILRTRRTSSTLPGPFVFREGMVIVIQPNIITADERMGIQVGEMMKIGPDGVEALHRYPMRFVQC